MLKPLLLYALVLIGNGLYAQTKAVEVNVYLKDGRIFEGVMEIEPDYPWKYQKSISIVDRSLYDINGMKGKDKIKYKAKEIKGYESEGRYYESKKVLIVDGGDSNERSITKSLPGYALIERIVEGNINIYKAYGYPPDIIRNIGVYDELRNNPAYFLARGSNGKPKLMTMINIEKWISDAPEVSKKYANGGYGNLIRKKNKKFDSFIKAGLENNDFELIMSIVNEYNLEMKKK